MRFGTRVWGLGKLLVLIGALGATFLLFFGISLRVALRAQDVDMPTLVGRTVDDATATLTVLGLAARVEGNPRPNDTVPAGRIVQQDPPAGRRTRRERTVRVWVSAGPRSATIPSLIGEPVRLAQIRLRQDNVEVAAMSEIRAADYETDIVVAQDPPPSSRAPRVSLLVNRGEQAIVYVMPDLSGVDATAATAGLQARGFRVTVNDVGGETAMPGTVVQQQPAAGHPVSAVDRISLEVAR
jgi:beta-lactam-binding protein with PASTA domain